MTTEDDLIKSLENCLKERTDLIEISNPDAYYAGYLFSLLRGLVFNNPMVQERIQSHIEIMSADNAEMKKFK
jgi:hypothetical protein